MAHSSSPNPPFRSDALNDALTEALTQVTHARQLLVATDFDGTIAPLCDDPLASRATPNALRALTHLAALANTDVAVVTGRPLSILTTLLPDHHHHVHLIASHGAEHRYLTSSASAPPPHHDPLRDAIIRDLNAISAVRPGTFVELKPHGAALHTRTTTPTHRALASASALALAHTYPTAHLLTGNNIVEYSTSPATKGEALIRLASHLGADGVVYLGDDVTDETAFTALSTHPAAVTIKVGAAPTAARFRIGTVADVEEVLAALAVHRAQHAEMSLSAERC